MTFALTTHWNAHRHTSGEAMIQEILDMGFSRVELGYDLRMDLVPGVLKMVKDKTIQVDSVHNFCPVPVGAPRGHPELYTLADKNSRIREGAIRHTTKTIEFAAEVGAKAIVVHAGNVDMKHFSHTLHALCEEGQQFSPLYEKTKHKLQVIREKKVKKHLKYLKQSIELLLPVLQQHKIILALENLPTWESIPTEIEMETLLHEFSSQYLRTWHDIGHGRIRQNLGFINHDRWLERLKPYTAGLHIHDVKPPVFDHVCPPQGEINFDILRDFASPAFIKVIEPSSREPREAVIKGLAYLKEILGDSNTSSDNTNLTSLNEE